MSRTSAVGAELLEERMQATFGMGHHEYEVSTADRVPTAYLSNAVRVVDRSGVLPLLAEWDAQRRKSNAGAKAVIPLNTVLVLFLLNVQMGYGVTYGELAKTLDIRLNKEQFERLGIRDAPGDRADWYQRIWQTSGRMLTLMDPQPAPRDHNASAEEFQALKARASTEEAAADSRLKLARLNWLCKRLVVTSVRMLPSNIWARYKGNTIIDATKLEIAGYPNSPDQLAKRSNPDPFSGRYRREGAHEGQGAKTDVAAYELETAVMAWNAPGENTDFPCLITAVSFHAPGKLIGHGAYLAKTVQEEFGFQHFLVIVDRAYNNEKVENFHIPLRKMGCELVIDYRQKGFGIQGHFEDLILLDGNWYVKWMPKKLIDATTLLAALAKRVAIAHDTLRAPKARKARKLPAGRDKLAAAKQVIAEAAERAEKVAAAEKVLAEAPTIEEKLRTQIANRERYRMLAKGRPDIDGFQRFLYPPTSRDLTGSAPASRKTITVPLLIPEGKSKSERKPQPVKSLQKFPGQSEIWTGYYGMRSLVEASNNLLKLASAEDIGNSKKRSGRGFAFHYIAATLAAVSTNIRRIITFFENEAERSVGERIRTRRRKDEHGDALLRQNELLTVPLAAP